jgi:hypothetical protein
MSPAEQHREPEIKPQSYKCLIFVFTKVPKIRIVEKRASSTDSAEKTGYPHVELS